VTLAAKVFGDMERQLEFAGAHRVRGEERLVGAPLGIRVDRTHAASAVLVDGSKIDAHAGSRQAGRSIEDVRCKRTHPGCHTSLACLMVAGCCGGRSLVPDAPDRCPIYSNGIRGATCGGRTIGGSARASRAAPQGRPRC
jgi:hypothetical protein